ncbi:MAG: flagellar hook-associated protein FlgK [Gammaproteobacteria bacterium]|nr:flagellar hook-associated protein FlgK [Gammaproteobacteria bacterium]
MADTFGIGISALQAYQRALATTGHNVANANTPGYSRQRVLFATRPAEFTGAGYVGSGVQIASIERIFDELKASQLNSATTGLARLEAFAAIAQSIGDRVADAKSGLGAGFDRLTSAAEDLATDPTSLPARYVFVNELQGLVNRFHQLSAHLESMDQAVEVGVRNSTTTINTLARSVADLNERIAAASSSGNPPNDLLDERSRLLNQLAGQVGITTTQETNGAVDVFVGNGQALVIGFDARELTLARSPLDPQQSDVQLGGASVTAQLSGGTLGGLLDARGELIEPARNELGRLATALSLRLNELNAQGLDLDGAQGGALLSVPVATGRPTAGNTGTATVAVTYADSAQFRADEYLLSFDGSNYSLRSVATGAPVSLAGSGTAADPFVFDGLEVVVSAGAAAGDRFLLQPFRAAAGEIAVIETDPRRVAAAAALGTVVGSANTGAVAVQSLDVTDSAASGFLDTVTIEFSAPNTYSVNGSGSFAYTPGSPIVLNGYQLTLTGAAAAGDRITVQANTGAVGDNRNALRLAGVASERILEGGAGSAISVNATLISRAGSAAQQADLAMQAQSAIKTDAEAAMAAVSGVNLDEEATNLLRYQQAYQAMAQVIGVADSLFQSLISALRR